MYATQFNATERGPPKDHETETKVEKSNIKKNIPSFYSPSKTPACRTPQLRLPTRSSVRESGS